MMSAVLAIDRDGTLGAGGRLPWHLPADLARFREITLGHTIVMGRRTFESIGRPLPGRRNVVLTRSPDYRPRGARAVLFPAPRGAPEVSRAVDGHRGAGEAPRHGTVVEVCTEPDAVRRLARDLGEEELFVVGGAEVFRLFLGETRRFYVTRIDADFPGDARFPVEVLHGLREVSCERRAPDARNPFPLAFCVYERDGRSRHGGRG